MKHPLAQQPCTYLPFKKHPPAQQSCKYVLEFSQEHVLQINHLTKIILQPNHLARKSSSPNISLLLPTVSENHLETSSSLAITKRYSIFHKKQPLVQKSYSDMLVLLLKRYFTLFQKIASFCYSYYSLYNAGCDSDNFTFGDFSGEGMLLH